MHGEKLVENCSKMLRFEQIMGAACHKIYFVWPPTSHLTDHPNKTNTMWWALLKNQEKTHVTFYHRFLRMDTSVLTDQQRLLFIILCADTRCCLKDQPRAMTIGVNGKRKSGNFVLSAELDDGWCIYIYIYIRSPRVRSNLPWFHLTGSSDERGLGQLHFID